MYTNSIDRGSIMFIWCVCSFCMLISFLQLISQFRRTNGKKFCFYSYKSKPSVTVHTLSNPLSCHGLPWFLDLLFSSWYPTAPSTGNCLFLDNILCQPCNHLQQQWRFRKQSKRKKWNLLELLLPRPVTSQRVPEKMSLLNNDIACYTLIYNNINTPSRTPSSDCAYFPDHFIPEILDFLLCFWLETTH